MKFVGKKDENNFNIEEEIPLSGKKYLIYFVNIYILC